MDLNHISNSKKGFSTKGKNLKREREKKRKGTHQTDHIPPFIFLYFFAFQFVLS